MIRPGNHSLKVHLHAGPVDMRKRMNGLACQVLLGKGAGYPHYYCERAEYAAGRL